MGLYQKQEFGIACDGESGKCPCFWEDDLDARLTVNRANLAGWEQQSDGTWICPACVSKRDGACEEDRKRAEKTKSGDQEVDRITCADLIDYLPDPHDEEA